jgi:hypothetical protein
MAICVDLRVEWGGGLLTHGRCGCVTGSPCVSLCHCAAVLGAGVACGVCVWWRVARPLCTAWESSNEQQPKRAW